MSYERLDRVWSADEHFRNIIEIENEGAYHRPVITTIFDPAARFATQRSADTVIAFPHGHLSGDFGQDWQHLPIAALKL